MKALILAIATFVCFGAYASDTKLGNVIAVEREITDIHQRCVQLTTEEQEEEAPEERIPKSFHICSFRFAADNEFQFTRGTVIRYNTDECDVSGDAMNGSVMITFNKKSAPEEEPEVNSANHLEESLVCLQQATSQQPIKVKIFTIE